MKVSRIVTRVRDRLDEATANIYTDVELVRYIDEAVNDMFRTQTQYDESWHNCEFNLVNATDGRALHSNWTLYDIPLWVHKITGLRTTASSTSQKERDLPYRTLHNFGGTFWTFHGHNRIAVVGADTSDDITVMCSKIPAPLNQGTLVAPDTLAFTTTSIHWDTTSATESVYEDLLEDDWHLNSIFEFTGTDTGAHAITGSVTRGATSSVSYDTDALFTSVTFDKAVSATPVAGDTWEMHAEVSTAHIGLLVNLATQKALIRKSNWEALNALAPDLEREQTRFIESVTPRQDQVLPFQGMDEHTVFHEDPDRDFGHFGSF